MRSAACSSRSSSARSGAQRLLVARFVGAVAASGLYVALVFAAGLLITGATGGWWPDRIVVPALELAGAVAIVTALSLLGSVFLTATANGIAVFMVFGAGLTAGLLGQVGEAIGSATLEDVSRVATWVLPFEALYQDALAGITADTRGLTRVAIDLGPLRRRPAGRGFACGLGRRLHGAGGACRAYRLPPQRSLDDPGPSRGRHRGQ